MLLECRIGGAGEAAQTIFPGSTHKETGEAIAWEDANEIARVDGAKLLRDCRILASAAILARHFPTVGGRHDGGLIVGGFLARCGFSASSTPGAKRIAEALCIATAQPPDKRRDIIRAVEDSVATSQRASPSPGCRSSRKCSARRRRRTARNGSATKPKPRPGRAPANEAGAESGGQGRDTAMARRGAPR